MDIYRSHPNQPDPRSKTPSPPVTRKAEESKSVKEKIKESLDGMNKEYFSAIVDCSGTDLVIKTMVCGIDYKLIYNEGIRKWDIQKLHKRDEQPKELSPYIDIFHNVTRTKSVAKKPFFFVMGWILYCIVLCTN